MFFTISGSVLLLIIFTDFIRTTLSLQGGGWFTKWLIRWVWQGSLYVCGHNGRARFLNHVGYILLLLLLLFWIFGLWGSYILILLASDGNIINPTTSMPASFLDKVYYAGYTISSLGNGELVPNSTGWRLVSSLFTFTGLIIITLSISYLIPALSAVINQSKLSIYLGSMGYTPSQILVNGWNGKNFTRLVDQCATVAPLLIDHSQNHRGYPVIHYFHNNSPRKAIALRLAALFEALLILKYYVRENLRPDIQDLAPVFTAFESYIELTYKDFQLSERVDLEGPVVGRRLIERGLVQDDLHPETLMSATEGRQREILALLVREDGWTFADVNKEAESFSSIFN